MSNVSIGSGGALKPYLNEGKKVGTVLGGFVAGHLGFGQMPVSFKSGVNGILATIVILALGVFTAVKAKNEYVQNAALGLSLYSTVKALNGAANLVPALPATGTPATGVTGLGFVLPTAASDFLKKIVPNLGDMGEPQPIPWNFGKMTIYDHDVNLGKAIDQTYETVGDLGAEGMTAAWANLIGKGTTNPPSPQGLPTPPPVINNGKGIQAITDSNPSVVIKDGQKFMLSVVNGLGSYQPMHGFGDVEAA